MHQRPFVVAGEQRVELAGVRTERIGERLRDPARVGMHERPVPHRVRVGGRSELVDPGLLVAPADGAQHSIDETGSRRIEFDGGLLDGGGDGGVGFDAGAQQLVAAQPKQVKQHGVDAIGRAPCGVADDGVEQAAGAAGAVGQLGGECGVAACDSSFAQQRGQCQVGVGVFFGHRAQHVERRASGRIKRFSARRSLVGRAGHSARASSSRRAPRAQSTALISFLPGG